MVDTGRPARLGINVDHVATLRQARGITDPDPVWAAMLCELAGADGIVVHLREDRRHIQERDLHMLRSTVRGRLNLEMAATADMVAIALDEKPDQATLVPERREELTTEGGLDIVGQEESLRSVVSTLQAAEIMTSLFVDPEPGQIEAAARTHAAAVELHTGAYANATTAHEQTDRLRALASAAEQASSLGMHVHAGHGLHYLNVAAMADVVEIEELNIGHAIIARAVMVGLRAAVQEMREAILRTHRGHTATSTSSLMEAAPSS